jgi:hypothetical protein
VTLTLIHPGFTAKMAYILDKGASFTHKENSSPAGLTQEKKEIL